MYKILVISDSHGLTETIDEIVSIHHIDAKIHCGDSELSKTSKHLINFDTVRGNCDIDSRHPVELIKEFHGLRFLITHGHKYGVKESLLALQYKALEVKADIILFGHSHYAYCEEIQNQLFINPGSISQPRGWPMPSYCVLSLAKDKSIQVNYYHVNGQSLTQLPFRQNFHLSHHSC